MSYPKVIGVSGFKNAGKDTVAFMLQYLLSTPKFLHSYICFKLFSPLFIKKYNKTSFANKLKEMLAVLLNVKRDQFEDREFKEKTYLFVPTLTISKEIINPISDLKLQKYLSKKDFSFLQEYQITIRQLLQVFGTEVMRSAFGNNIWITSTLKTNKPIIISDLRFRCEKEAIENLNGCIIYIIRPGCIAGNHASEREMNEMDQNHEFKIKLINNGSLKDLFNNVKKIAYNF